MKLSQMYSGNLPESGKKLIGHKLLIKSYECEKTHTANASF